jgi:hypothetical protein
MRSSLTGLLLASLVLALPAASWGKVYHSRQEALALAFPDAERVEARTHVLTDAQQAEIQRLSGAELDSKLVKVYLGMKQGEVQGYAFIEVHTVRTLPEAFLVVLDRGGEVRSLRVLAFYEPLEYQPADRWYGQFEHKTLREPLRLGNDIHGIVGATLSARATTQGVRRALALYRVLVENGD